MIMMGKSIHQIWVNIVPVIPVKAQEAVTLFHCCQPVKQSETERKALIFAQPVNSVNGSGIFLSVGVGLAL